MSAGMADDPATRSTRKLKAARRAFALASVVVALTCGALAAPVQAASAGSDEARLLALTNDLRVSVGAPTLSLDSSVSSVARGWSASMAARGGISHNEERSSQISGWLKLGENVGMGGSIDSVHDALVNSPLHYRNLVDPDFTVVGIGVAYSGSTVYITQNFVKPSGGGNPVSAPEAAAAPAEPESESAPVATFTTQAPQEVAPIAEPAPQAPAGPAAEPEPVHRVESIQINFVIEQVRTLGIR